MWNTTTNGTIYYTINTNNTSTTTRFDYTSTSNYSFYKTYNYDISDVLTYNTNIIQKLILFKGVLESTNLVKDAEEQIEEFIYDNIDNCFIKEHGLYTYSYVINKGYDICEEIINSALEKDYALDERNKDDVIEELFNLIDFNSIFKIIDDIN